LGVGVAVHSDITRKDDVTLALTTANAALGIASGMMTANAGAVFIPDGELADGEDAGRNGILIGSDANGFNGAAHVNDGKLEPIVDTAALEAANAEFQEALDAAKARMDDAQGNLNAAIDQMELNRQEAADATQSVRDDLTETENSMNSYIASNDNALQDAVASINTVSDAANNAQNAADKVAGDLKATDVKVTENTTNLGGLSTQMTTVKETADASLGLSTQHTQDIKGISDRMTEDYLTKDATLSKVAEVQKSADAISTKLTSDYTTTADADMKFSTKAELTASANGIKSEVDKTYATKESVTSQVATVQHTAESISATLSTDYQKKSDADKVYATQAALKATSDEISSEVSKTYATKAVTDALQNIADNAVETFMGSAVPTISNVPAKDWNTDALRKRHSGDIYYSTTDGKSYRYGNPDNRGWQWTLIQDSDITKAIQDAANAQNTANTANSGVQKLNTDIPLTYATKTNVSETADAIKLEAAKTYATQKSLTDAQSAIKITTDGISADVSKNYQTTSTADEKYATKASLKATDDKIATSISAQASKDASTYSTKNELSQTASGLDGRITETAQTASGNLTTTKNEFQAKVDSINTTLSQTNNLMGYDSFPTEIDTNRPNQWYCAIYPLPTPSIDASKLDYTMFNGLTATVTKYVTDTTGALFNYAVNYAYYMMRTIVTFSADTQWQFTFRHDDSGRILVDGSSVYFVDHYMPTTDTITIAFTSGTHTVDILVGNATGGAGMNNFSVPLSTIATTMYAPASQAELSKDATALTNRVSSAEQNLDGFKNTVSTTYTTKSDTAKQISDASQSLANQVAQTYTTKSEFTQTTDRIQGQVSESLGAVSGGNMVYNPGFELGQTENSYATNWHWGGDGVTGKVDNTAGLGIHSGDWRFYASLPDGKTIWINSRWSMTLMQGHTYKVSAWVYLDKKGTVDLGLESRTESGLVGDYDRSVPVNVSGEYTEISTYITATRDHNNANVYLRFEQSKIGSNVRLDDVSCIDASDYSELSSRVTQTAQQWGVQLNQVATANNNAIADLNDTLDNQSDALTATSDKIDDEISQRQAYMNFTQDETGNPLLELGASQNSNKVDITNDRVSFKSEGAEVAYISNRELHINNAIIVKSLEIAGFAFLIRADGHLTLTKI
jgi:hypothetical protein